MLKTKQIRSRTTFLKTPPASARTTQSRQYNEKLKLGLQ